MNFNGVVTYLSKLAELFESRHSRREKLEILLTSIKMKMKYRILLSDQGQAEEILGKKWLAIKYRHLGYLFDEIFVGGEYFFVPTNKTPIILDVGANIGVATLFFKTYYPEAIVYAFEPDITAYNILRRNIGTNAILGVETYNFAISDKKGKIEFYIDPKFAGGGSSSTRCERTLGKKVEVDCITLSSFINRELGSRPVDFLKMDIEGSEQESIPELFETKTLDKIREGVIEYHHKIGNEKSKLSQFLGYLEKAGFEYQIIASDTPTVSKKHFQDVLIHFYREFK
jgi:FkbM family methyltransferase